MAVWTTPTDRSTLYVVTTADWNIVEDNLTYLYGDTGWTAVSSFTNSWGASGTAPGYILIGRMVFLRGAMTAGTGNIAAFTLPSGYRPSQQCQFIVSAGSATTNMVLVGTAGTVTPLNSATTWLNNVSFPIV